MPTPPFPYNAGDHYWIVGGNESVVFSSNRGDFVPSNDAQYAQWLASFPGRKPTRIDTVENLGDVLSGALVRPVNAAVLDGYQASHAGRLSIQLVAKVLLWCVNQIRAGQGQNALNAQQFKQFLKGMM